MIDTMSLSKVLVTGSSGGLGFYIAKYFLEKGHAVVLHGRNKEKLNKINENFCNKGSQSNFIIGDLSSTKDIKKIAEYAIEEKVKILINNAGLICPGLEFSKITNKIIHTMIDVNLKAPILLLNALQDHIHQVININSMVGMESKVNRTMYASSKWGLRGFSDSLKKEDVKYNILDVYPTNIKTWQDRENAMEIDFVVEKIYNSMIDGKTELILDGRK
jgi:short-subunit dehydrogenase